MKSILMGAVALSLIAAPAFAQSASADIELGGTVAPACGLGNHISGASVNPLWAQGDVTVDMVDAEGQFNGDFFDDRSVGNVWCNAASNVTFTVTPFATSNSSTDTGSFSNSFVVRVTTDMGVYFGAGVGAVVASTKTVNGTASGSTAGAFETGLGRFSGMDIEVLPEIGSGGNNKRPVAGAYTGSVTFTASVS